MHGNGSRLLQVPELRGQPPNPLRSKVSSTEPKTSEYDVSSIGLESNIYFPISPF